MTHVRSIEPFEAVKVSSSDQGKAREFAPPSLKRPCACDLGPKETKALKNFALKFLEMELKRDTATREQQLLQMQFTAEMQNLYKLNQEELHKKVKENAETYAQSSFWNLLTKIARYVIHVINVALGVGISFTGVGVPLGCALITSGMLGITTEVMTDIGGWEWMAKQATDDVEVQKKIVTLLPMISTALTITLSCVSSGFALFSEGAKETLKVLLTWNVISSLAEGGLQIGKASVQYKIDLKKVEIEEISDHNFPLSKKIEYALEKLNRSLKSAKDEVDSAREITALEIANRRPIRLSE